MGKILPVLLVFSLAVSAAGEQITVTTYYPAPSGIYNQMVTTAQTLLARDGGNVGVGLGASNPTVKLHIADNSALRIGNAYLSSGGDYAHLANNEWYDGSAWHATAAGALIQITGQTVNFFTHDAAGSHTTTLSVNADGTLTIRGGSPGAGKVLTSDASGNASWAAAAGGGGGLKTYVGATAATYSGSTVGGYAGGDAKCAANFAGSRMCTAPDFVNGRPAVAGWYSTFVWSSYQWWTGFGYATNTYNDCLGWTVNIGSFGAYWSGGPSNQACNSFQKILCCR